MNVDGSFTEHLGMSKSGDKAVWLWNDGVAVSSENIILDLNAIGVAATLTVVAK